MSRVRPAPRKEREKMERPAARGEWRGLIKIEDVPAFGRWLTDERHEWMGQSPDVGEALRVHKYGLTRVVRWDGHQTRCGRHMMALWYTFCCFRDDEGKDD